MNLQFEDISNGLLLLTAIVASYKYKKVKNTPLEYLPYYLWYATILEFTGDILLKYGFSNIWWYNIGINFEILFYLWVYYQYIKSSKTKKFIGYGSIIYLIYFISQIIFFESINQYQVFPFTFGSVIIIVTIFLFLLEMFQSDKVLHVKKYLIFWISIGLLFYYIIPLPLFIVRSIIPIDMSDKMMGIQYLANCIMYLLFIFGFLWSSMNYKSSS